MSSSPTVSSPTSSARGKKLVVPKVWKRPHSTIYSKNVEFGSALYSDKIGELNGRKFNSELPWTLRNSGSVASSSGGQFSQGYLSSASNLLLVEPNSVQSKRRPKNFAELLEMTNPSRANRLRLLKEADKSAAAANNQRIDFYDQYSDFSREIDQLNNNSLFMNEPLLTRKTYDNYLDFDAELGLFVPSSKLSNDSNSSSRNSSSSCCSHLNSPLGHHRISSLQSRQPLRCVDYLDDINSIKSFVPLPTKTQTTNLLPKHNCQLVDSPYGQSTDGRKLSLGSINPQSYRPSLPHKNTTAHASDGEEFEFQDKSSPFYTDRWVSFNLLNVLTCLLS